MISTYQKIFYDARVHGHAVAFCRLPSEEKISVFVGSRLSPGPVHTSSQELQFVFSPFANGNQAYILSPDILFQDKHVSDPGDHHRDLHGITVGQSTDFSQNHESTRDEFIHRVRDTVHAIHRGELKKVIVARCVSHALPQEFDPVANFFTLCAAYPHACVYLFSSPVTGLWTGASPEKLLSLKGGTIETVALAGTLPVEPEGTWTAKEREEHRLVEAFIANEFEKHNLAGYQKSEVKTIVAGKLKHLRSTFIWTSNTAAAVEKWDSLLSGLNPTPAVCGLPKTQAMHFIKNNEGFDRRFYSGFAGIAGQHTADIFVNLRCMELFPEKALLYAGAGITADSIPEQEWLETETKMETLRGFL